jgi:hypothetical protein
MRRGVGLADLLLYVFALFLIIIALIITGLPGFTTKEIQIKSADAHAMIRTSIALRSAFESMPLARVEDDSNTIDYSVFSVSRAESLPMMATYKDPAVNDVPIFADSTQDRPFISSELQGHMMGFTLAPLRHDRMGDHVPKEGVLLPAVSIGRSTLDPLFVSGVESETFRSDETRFWVPGYVGTDIHARGMKIGLNVPAEVVPYGR